MKTRIELDGYVLNLKDKDRGEEEKWFHLRPSSKAVCP